MISPYWNILTVSISLIASFFYIKSVIKGDTIPNKMGWFIWILAPLVSSFIMLKNGGGLSALPVFMSWIIPLFVFIASFYNKKSYWKISTLDIICLLCALVALYFWLVAKNIISATIFAVLADAFGFIPTIVKSWSHPQTEKPWPYMAGFFNALISILTLTTYPFYLYAFPAYLIFGNLTLLATIYRNQLKKQS